MTTIIDFFKLKKLNKKVEETDDFKEGFLLVGSLSETERRQLTTFVMGIVDIECRIGLGISGLTPDEIDQYGELPFFNLINAAHKEAEEGNTCYFCNQNVDPNETAVSRETKACPDCQFKLANFLKWVGFEYFKDYLNIVKTDRPIQVEKARPGEQLKF
jgi:hypothetical protein